VIRSAGALALCCLLAGLQAVHGQITNLEGGWVLTVGEDPSSYEVVTWLQQDSTNSIKDEYATKDVMPRLLLRCAPGDPTITARIDWQRFISSFNTEVGFRVDGGKTLWLKWGVDRSNKITLSPSADDSKNLVEYLREGTSLQVEVSPYSESPVTVEYDLTGFVSGLDALLKDCGQA
jgi:type VI secretion system protein VasI